MFVNNHLSRLNSSVIIGSFFISSVLLLQPIWKAPSRLIMGNEQGDVYKHLWSFWHTLSEIQTWPWTTKLNTPHGGFLLDVMFAPALVLSPVSSLMGPVWAANIFVCLSFFLIGWTLYLLCLQKGFSKGEAFCAGLLCQSFPYLLGYPLASGVYERLSIWVFPLLLFLLGKYHRKGKVVYLIGGGAFLSYFFVLVVKPMLFFVPCF